jgi:hypothetical protein
VGRGKEVRSDWMGLDGTGWMNRMKWLGSGSNQGEGGRRMAFLPLILPVLSWGFRMEEGLYNLVM